MATFTLEGFVGDELNVKNVSEKLEELKGEDIVVNLYTPGGNVYEGIEIYNRISNYPGKKTAVIGSVVASIGMYILAAFDEIKAQDLSVIYMHNVHSFAMGDYKKLKKEAETVERLNTHVAEVWSKRSGKKLEEVLEIMDNDTYFYGQEIVDNGFADELIETGKAQDRDNAIILAKRKYKNEEEKYIRRVAALENSDAVGSGNIGNKEKPIMDKKELLEKLNALKTNGEITLLEIAESLGLREQLMTDEAKKALNVMNSLAEKGIKDINTYIDELEAMRVEADKTKRENALLENFGPEKFSDGAVNEVRRYAEQRYSGDVTIDEIKNDSITKKLKAEQADYLSDTNTIGIVESQRDDSANDDVEVIEA